MEIEQITSKMREDILAASLDGLIFNDFQKQLPKLRETSLYRIFKAMPKGRLMHAHIEATFNVRDMLSLAIANGGVYVFLDDETPEFRHCQLAHRGWFEDGVIPDGWASLNMALANDPLMKEKLFSMCTSGTGDIDENIWPKFEAIFDRYKAVNNCKPIFMKLYTKVFMDMAAEGLMGVDLRFISQTIFEENGRRLTPDEYVDTVKEIEAEVRKSFPGFHINLIYSYYKGVPAETVPERLAHARHLQEKYPDVFIGYDMVGGEDCGKDLLYYTPVLRDAGVPIIMHAGETVNPDNRNIEYALDLGVRRLGHGLNLYRYPELEARVKADGVMLEVCPLSNQLLGYVPDLRLHPAAGYIKRGLNVTINSDDCAIFDTAYITDDLLLAYLCWDLSIADIKRCLKNSLCGDPAMEEIFEASWAEFESSL
ncbi:MAG: hypothetical protein IJS30_05945 [Bacteroidales bacterium]|nr:hypothetical protein [Bacteroidales bacterium]